MAADDHDDGVEDEPDLRRLIRAFRSSVSARFTEHDQRFDRLEARMGGLEDRMDGLEGRMEGLEGRMRGLERQVLDLGDELRTRMQTSETAILNAIRDWGRVIDARLTRVEGRLDGAA